MAQGPQREKAALESPAHGQVHGEADLGGRNGKVVLCVHAVFPVSNVSLKGFPVIPSERRQVEIIL